MPASSPALADVSAVLNPAAAYRDGMTHLLVQVQNRGRESFLFMATSADGARFELDPERRSEDGAPRVISDLPQFSARPPTARGISLLLEQRPQRPART